MIKKWKKQKFLFKYNSIVSEISSVHFYSILLIFESFRTLQDLLNRLFRLDFVYYLHSNLNLEVFLLQFLQSRNLQQVAFGQFSKPCELQVFCKYIFDDYNLFHNGCILLLPMPLESGHGLHWCILAKDRTGVSYSPNLCCNFVVIEQHLNLKKRSYVFRSTIYW